MLRLTSANVPIVSNPSMLGAPFARSIRFLYRGGFKVSQPEALSISEIFRRGECNYSLNGAAIFSMPAIPTRSKIPE